MDGCLAAVCSHGLSPANAPLASLKVHVSSSYRSVHPAALGPPKDFGLPQSPFQRPPSRVTLEAAGACFICVNICSVRNGVYVLMETLGAGGGGEEPLGLLRVETLWGPAGTLQGRGRHAGDCQ